MLREPPVCGVPHLFKYVDGACVEDVRGSARTHVPCRHLRLVVEAAAVPSLLQVLAKRTTFFISKA
jgi:hypothetical protein